MTDTAFRTSKDEKSPSLAVRAFAAAIAGGVTSYTLTWCSLNGVDFTTLGVSSEIVKGTITGTVSGYIVAPLTLAYAIRDMIVGAKSFFLVIFTGKEKE